MLSALERFSYERGVEGLGEYVAAELSIALMDWRTPAWRQASAKA
ncbi:hypothetical protein ACFWZR_16615 [Streptomyces sp. NPDC059017]